MKFATITPTRDRPRLFRHCKEQLDRQTLQPDARYYIAYEPTSQKMDLVKRVRSGIELAQRDGIDAVVIFEDDDAVKSNYLERCFLHLKRFDFVGDQRTYYYNILTLRWSLFTHPGRSSLFTTAFRLSAIDRFTWPPDDHRFLDIDLWKFAIKDKASVKYIDSGSIGIKHSIGKCGGKGHKMRLDNSDPEMKFLKSRLEPYQIEFYEQLRRDLATTTIRQ